MRAPAILTAGYEVNPMITQEQYAPPEDILSDVLTALCHAVARAIELRAGPGNLHRTIGGVSA
jgi:hypothetical protein